MRTLLTLLAMLALVLAAGPAAGQSLLNKLESKLKAPAGGAAADAATPADTSPYLGLEPEETTDGNGVLVLKVRKGAPSELGGLREGDVITGINGRPCRKVADLDAVLDASKAGTKLTMTVARQGKQETKIVTLGRRPIEAAPPADPGEAPAEPAPVTELPPPTRPASPATRPAVDSPTDPAEAPPTLRPFDPVPLRSREPDLNLPEAPPREPAPATEAPPASEALPGSEPTAEAPAETPPLPPAASEGRASLGIKVVPLNDETRLNYDVRSSARQGALIVGINPGSPADSAGLPLMGVVVSIDGQLVKSDEDLVEAIVAARPGQQVELRYYQGPRLATKTVRLGPSAASGSIPAAPRDLPGVGGIGSGVAGAPDRPLLNKFEDMVESLGSEPPKTTLRSTIIDPSRFAEMYEDIKSMKETIQSLQEQVKLLEAKLGPEAPAANP